MPIQTAKPLDESSRDINGGFHQSSCGLNRENLLTYYSNCIHVMLFSTLLRRTRAIFRLYAHDLGEPQRTLLAAIVSMLTVTALRSRS